MILPGGGISHANAKSIVHEWGVRRLHIGTCVRKNKYGDVDKDLLINFRKLLDGV